jgi:hypothetical protein
MEREIEMPSPPTEAPKKPGRSSGASPGRDWRWATKRASPECVGVGG